MKQLLRCEINLEECLCLRYFQRTWRIISNGSKIIYFITSFCLFIGYCFISTVNEKLSTLSTMINTSVCFYRYWQWHNQHGPTNVPVVRPDQRRSAGIQASNIYGNVCCSYPASVIAAPED